MTILHFGNTSRPSSTSTEMTYELDRLEAKIGRRLERAGLKLTELELAELTGEILDDAVRIALVWLGETG